MARQDIRQIILLFTITIAISCAKQSAPGGGPRDEIPPKIIESNPPNKTINFSGKSFEITFDEYFVLDDINQKLMISPPIEKKPEIKTKNKTLIVNFDEELIEDITYTFYFLDAIRDLNENNPIDNYQYVFATGNILDSLSVTGKIFDAGSLDPLEDVLILLYSGSNDTLPVTTMPRYISRAKKDGSFRIDNISEGEYSIYGLTDLNNSKIYDLQDEAFSFIDSTINISVTNNYIPPLPDTLITMIQNTRTDSLRSERIPGKEYLLFVSTPENKNQYLSTTDRSLPYKLSFIFARPVEHDQFLLNFPETDSVNYLLEKNSGLDTITIWLKDSIVYTMPSISAEIVYPETDSTGIIAEVTDTIDFRYTAPKQTRGRRKAKKESLSYKLYTGSRSGLPPGKNPYYVFETPMMDPDTSQIGLFMIVDTNMLRINYEIVRDSVYNKRFDCYHSFEEDSAYLLITDAGAFTDMFGNKNDSAGVRFIVRNRETFGKLIINLSGYKGEVILQLMDTEEVIKRENHLSLPEDSRVEYPFLEKGKYRLKIIFDTDGNGKWTPGDFSIKRQPEAVTYYKKTLTMKVDWELEQDWAISDVRYKSKKMRKKLK
ncbi:MAG: Ig-like domain-containing protein [Bacteroidales bacterium]|nr:Ig-like domain-containing protein [Bacteroidales bacterium]